MSPGLSSRCMQPEEGPASRKTSLGQSEGIGGHRLDRNDTLEDDDAMVWSAVKEATGDRRRKLRRLAYCLFGFPIDAVDNGPALSGRVEDSLAVESTHSAHHQHESNPPSFSSSPVMQVTRELPGTEDSVWVRLKRGLVLSRRTQACRQVKCDDLPTAGDQSMRQILHRRVVLQEIQTVCMNHFQYS